MLAKHFDICSYIFRVHLYEIFLAFRFVKTFHGYSGISGKSLELIEAPLEVVCEPLWCRDQQFEINHALIHYPSNL
jgi:hypothetical protein